MGKNVKRVGVAALVVTGALGMGVAFAAWLATGGGTGQAEAVTAQVLTATPNTPAAAGLYPGRTGANVYVKITNPNPYPVSVTSISQDGAITTVSGDSLCDASTGVSFTTQTGPYAVPANSNADFVLAAANMTNASADECQGEVFDIPVTLSGVSAAA